MNFFTEQIYFEVLKYFILNNHFLFFMNVVSFFEMFIATLSRSSVLT